MRGTESGHKITWSSLEIGQDQVVLPVSNKQFPIPQGLELVPCFVDQEEAEALLYELDRGEEEHRQWKCQGFEQRRRVQRYRVSSNQEEERALPPRLEQLVMRFAEKTGQSPQYVVVEEYPFASMFYSTSHRVATSFESTTKCDCGSDAENECNCFVAQVALLHSAVQHLNRPKELDNNCWHLKSPIHWTDLKMEPGSLIIKSGESLWQWRSRVCRGDDCSESDRVVLIKFHNLKTIGSDREQRKPSLSKSSSTVSLSSQPAQCVPPLEELLTLVITTSPVKSNPSTELLERVFDTFLLAGHDFAYKCRKVIVCDGCRILEQENDDDNDESATEEKKEMEPKVSRKHANVKQALRSGIATTVQAENYQLFKQALSKLCRDAPADSPFCRAVVEELTSRHGYGFALRHALRHRVSTPYVCVIQHDRTFMRTTPIAETVHAMWADPDRIKYVGLSMRSNLMYHDIFLSKYGKAALVDLGSLLLRPPQLALDASKFGPDSESTASMIMRTEKLQKNVDALVETYRSCSQYREEQEWACENPYQEGKHQLTLTPTLFWYDNTHICETAHYRDFICDEKFKMLRRGGFIEEGVSPIISRNVERVGLADGHGKFGCYLLDDHSGYFFTGHLDGGSYLTEEQRVKERRKFAGR